MATLARNRSGSWKVSWRNEKADGRIITRSVAVDDHDEALRFLALVREAGDQRPRPSVLKEHGLLHLAGPINPEWALQVREILELDDYSDEEKLRLLNFMVENL